MGLSYDEIAEILKIIDGSSCDELVVDTGDMKLVVRRNSAGGAHVPQDDRPGAAPQPISPIAPLAPAAQPSNRQGVADKTAAKIAATAAHQAEIVAPMVGTFYRAPAPDAPPFVEIGAAVRKGQPLCLIEVMKLFTTIASEHDGRIVAIGAENGELVEYGRTLFVIDPT
ncbi:MAG: acetyl-CoA carboxylase biotin carboxyl carrier protein [Xanthobacteraceae bacterium]